MNFISEPDRARKTKPRRTSISSASVRIENLCRRYRPVVARWARHCIPNPARAEVVTVRVLSRARGSSVDHNLFTSVGTWFFRLFIEEYQEECPDTQRIFMVV